MMNKKIFQATIGLILTLTVIGSVYAVIDIFSNEVSNTISETTFTLDQISDVYIGQDITFEGTLGGANNSGVTIMIQIKPTGADNSAYTLLDTTTTDINGDYSLTWEADVVGDFTFRAVASV